MTPEQHRNQAALLRLSEDDEAHRRADLHDQIANGIERRAAGARQAGDTWNESDHPRGQPGNKGQFGTGGGGRDPAAEGARAVREDDEERERARAAAAPAAPRRSGAYAGQYETSGATPLANHALTVSRVLANPVNRGIHYRRMLAQLIREAPGFNGQSAIPGLRSKLISALVQTHESLRLAGRTVEADRVVATLRRMGGQQAPAAPAPAPPAPAPMRTRPLAVEPTPAPASTTGIADKLRTKYGARKEAIESYEMHVKEDPDVIVAALGGPMAGILKNVRIEGGYRPGTLSFRATIADPVDAGSISRTLNFITKTVSHDFLIVPKSKRKAGKEILASQMALYQKLGMEKVEVHADIDVGAYAWAKYGFVPKQESWNALRSNLGTRIKAVEMGSTTVDKAALADFKKLLSDPNPKTIWKVVDHPAKVTVGGKDTTVAKAIMTGSAAPHWYGSLDMRDKETMNRFQSYVGKDA